MGVDIDRVTMGFVDNSNNGKKSRKKVKRCVCVCVATRSSAQHEIHSVKRAPSDARERGASIGAGYSTWVWILTELRWGLWTTATTAKKSRKKVKRCVCVCVATRSSAQHEIHSIKPAPSDARERGASIGVCYSAPMWILSEL
jgi:uncharacterized protein YegP (UPF0339 family)